METTKMRRKNLQADSVRLLTKEAIELAGGVSAWGQAAERPYGKP
jgi:hypothetical protein